MNTLLTAQSAEKIFKQMREKLNKDGYLFFKNVEDGFDYLGFLQRFGKPRPQYDGEMVWSIKPDPKFDGVYHSLNTEPLYPHTEYYEKDGLPNRYQALWCITPSEGEGGKTLIADGVKFLDTLSKEEYQYFLEKEFEFGASAGITQSGLGSTARHHVIEKTSDGKILRFSYNNIHHDDPKMKDFADRLLAWFENNNTPITYKRNSLLMWDNFRYLHSRTGFKDRKRELKRVFLD